MILKLTFEDGQQVDWIIHSEGRCAQRMWEAAPWGPSCAGQSFAQCIGSLDLQALRALWQRTCNQAPAYAPAHNSTREAPPGPTDSSDGTGSGPQPDQPSNDPDTPVPDDPTRDVVGNLPLLYAHKTVVISQDFGTLGIVDPGDVLLYTIAISNTGAIPATGCCIGE